MERDLNINTDFDTNFEEAYNLSNKTYSHEELISMLREGSVIHKQCAALNFDYVKNEEDAKALLNNLTGCDGKIREAVAFKINSLLFENPDVRKIFASIGAKTFADATIDINANICRFVTESAAMLKSFDVFSSEYTNQIIKFSLEALEEIDKFIFKDKKYVINKQVFKLYWCLEALKVFHVFAPKDIILNILEHSSKLREYTIREKVAHIISSSNDFDSIKLLLLKDDNYYVKQALHHPSFL